MKIANYRSGFAHLFIVIFGGIFLIGGIIFIASGLGPNVLTGLVVPSPVQTILPSVQNNIASPTKPFVTNSVDDQILVSTLTKELKQINTARSVTNSTPGDSNARLKTIAKSRKDALLRLAKKDPRAFLSTALTQTQRNQLPVDVQSDIEKAVTVTGKMTVYQFDDFANKKSHFEYSIKTASSKKLTFYPTTPIAMSSGAQVSVSGFQLENVVVAGTDRASFSVQSASPPTEAIGDQKTIFLLFNFSDSNPPPFTLAQARELIFSGQMQKFYAETSYGKVSFSGDVYGWFTLPRACGGSACTNPFLSDSQTDSFIFNNNIDLSKYTRVVFIVNSLWGGGGYSSLGRSWVTLSNGSEYNVSQSTVLALQIDNSWSYNIPFPFSSFDEVLAHELGHALGVLHANSWDCGVGQMVYGRDCVHKEYGNLFDVMGSPLGAIHFNGYYKTLYGWLDSSSILKITQSGDYTLAPLEKTSGLRVAKIQPRDASRPYYVEYRQGVGFDAALAGAKNPSLISNTQGLFVNFIDDTNYYPFPRLINMRPGPVNWDQVTLNGTTIYDDAGRGIKIGPIKSNDANGITFGVQVSDPKCVRDYPSSLFLDHVITTTPESSVGTSIIVMDRDSIACGPSDIELSSVAPPDWSISITNPVLTVLPDNSNFSNVQIDVPASATVGKGNIVSIKARNRISGLEKIILNIEFQVLPPPTPPLIITSPTGGESWGTGTSQKISWLWTGKQTSFSVSFVDINGAKTGATPTGGINSSLGSSNITVPSSLNPGKFTLEMCDTALKPICASSGGTVLLTLPTSALPDWTNKLTAVWNLEENGGNPTFRNNSSANCGTKCNLMPNTIIPNSKEKQEGYYSNNFIKTSTSRLYCSSGACTPLKFPSSFTLGCWARPTTEATSLKLVASSGFMSRGRFANNIYAKGYAMIRGSSWMGGKAVNYLNCIGGDGANRSVNGISAQSQLNTFPTNAWTHAVCRYDTTTDPDNFLWSSLVAVTNGKASTPTNVKIVQDNLAEFTIGANYSTSSSSYFDGQLDECFATNSALSNAALCRIARCGIKGEQCTCSSSDPKAYISTGRPLNCKLETIPCNAPSPI
ncbi:MAG: LamG-like jellyroll fold domain-containing protein [bacterium]|nr:LamG-like jellyroll fold domain-containing protein [bacterium]